MLWCIKFMPSALRALLEAKPDLVASTKPTVPTVSYGRTTPQTYVSLEQPDFFPLTGVPRYIPKQKRES